MVKTAMGFGQDRRERCETWWGRRIISPGHINGAPLVEEEKNQNIYCSPVVGGEGKRENGKKVLDLTQEKRVEELAPKEVQGEKGIRQRNIRKRHGSRKNALIEISVKKNKRLQLDPGGL